MPCPAITPHLLLKVEVAQQRDLRWQQWRHGNSSDSPPDRSLRQASYRLRTGFVQASCRLLGFVLLNLQNGLQTLDYKICTTSRSVRARHKAASGCQNLRSPHQAIVLNVRILFSAALGIAHDAWWFAGTQVEEERHAIHWCATIFMANVIQRCPMCITSAVLDACWTQILKFPLPRPCRRAVGVLSTIPTATSPEVRKWTHLAPKKPY